MNASRISEEEFTVLKMRLYREKLSVFPVVTGSMEPLIMTGDMIQVAPLTGPSARFDIIVYWNGQNLICHYVHHRNHLPDSDGKDLIITRGLASPGEDLPVPVGDILGKVVSHTIGPFTRFRLALKSWRNRRV